jgi:MarR family transcriptional regulator, organic hydroperoxide resistance regulator
MSVIANQPRRVVRSAPPRARVVKQAAVAADRFPLGPTLSFLSRWWALNHALEKASRRMHARIGVTAPQRMLVRVIGKYPGISPGQLARIVHLDPGTISTAIGRLEAACVLERRRAGSDRRSVSLVLARRGEIVDVPDSLTIEGALERTLAHASRAQVDHIRSFIERFIAELEADRPRAGAASSGARAANGAARARGRRASTQSRARRRQRTPARKPS